MTDFGSIINGINQVTQVVGAVNGAVNVLAPTLQSVNGAVNNIANTFNPGYSQDYMQQPNYYPTNVMPNNVMPQSFSSSDDGSPIGTIGSALSGGIVGALQGRTVAQTIKGPSASDITGDSGISSKLSGGKSILTSGLKAGGIGAAIGGLFSGIQNIMKLNKNEITGSEATGNIAADTAVGFFSGMGGLATGSMAAMMMGGLGSLPVTIGAAALGLAGAVGVDLLFRKTGMRDSIANGIRNMVG